MPSASDLMARHRAGSLEDQIQALVSRIAGPDRLPAQIESATPLGEGGFWLDSVEMVDLLVACEDEFGLVLDDQALAASALSSLGSLVEAVRRGAGT
jgi:acyl carrier protein